MKACYDKTAMWKNCLCSASVHEISAKLKQVAWLTFYCFCERRGFEISLTADQKLNSVLPMLSKSCGEKTFILLQVRTLPEEKPNKGLEKLALVCKISYSIDIA